MHVSADWCRFFSNGQIRSLYLLNAITFCLLVVTAVSALMESGMEWTYTFNLSCTDGFTGLILRSHTTDLIGIYACKWTDMVMT